MTISVIGHGYVGLVTGAVFADFGNTVFVVGRTKEKIEKLQKGILPFFEPGLEETVKRNLEAGRLIFTLNYKEAIPQSRAVLICVGTPPKENGEADLSSVFTAAKEIARFLRGFTVIACKSTVPVGVNKKIAEIIKQRKPPKAVFAVASLPEFLREGTALSDTLHPDRIVIGTEDEKAKKVLLDLHKPIDGQCVLTDIKTAEMIKYAANAMLSLKISFANAMAFVCEKAGANIEKVMEGVGLDRRLGREFLYPGIGYGGSCFPKDVKALIAITAAYGYDFKLLRAVDEINEEAWKNFVRKVLKVFGGNIKGKTIGILGLSFKPNTDDMREAPSVKIIRSLLEKKGKIKVYDPKAMNNASLILKDVVYCKDSYEVAKGAEALLIITEWNEFKDLDLPKIKQLMKKPVIIDGRNIYEPEKLKSLGFTYISVGR